MADDNGNIIPVPLNVLEQVNVGIASGDQNADTLRAGMMKINRNFTKVLLKPQHLEIASDLTIPPTHNGWTYLAKANVTITLNEDLHSGFQAQCITMGGVITLQAITGCQLRKKDGTLTQTITMQDGNTLAITRFANNIFHVTGEID